MITNKYTNKLKSCRVVLTLIFGYHLVDSGVALDDGIRGERHIAIDRTLCLLLARLAGIPSTVVWGADCVLATWICFINRFAMLNKGEVRCRNPSLDLERIR